MVYKDIDMVINSVKVDNVKVFHSSAWANISTIWICNAVLIIYFIICTFVKYISFCGFIPDILLAAFEMQISCLAIDHHL